MGAKVKKKELKINVLSCSENAQFILEIRLQTYLYCHLSMNL